MSRLGVPDERIAFLPSWETDGRELRSAAARTRWPRHRRYTTGFDDLPLRTSLLPAAAGVGDLREVSAGGWRDVLLPADAPRPPVHPQHERRKYLAGGRLLGFAGLGGLAERRAARAARLADAGYGPAPRGVAYGFLVRDLVPGTPATRGAADARLIERMAAYLAHLRTAFPAAVSAGTPRRDELREMVTTNVREGLGVAGVRSLERHRRTWGEPDLDAPVELDGRMLPQEWVRCEEGHRKVDALDHHDDHFFPGPADIAWDLAGAAVEFDLDAAGRARLLDRYRRASGDRNAPDRLPAWAVAYLAFRMGYATLAAETLPEGEDRCGFAHLAGRYAAGLRIELAATAASRWSA